MSAAARSSCLALVTDAFGGTGGIAQYNRDFLAALAESPPISSVEVRPRRASGGFSLPSGIEQTRPHQGRVRYALGALIAAFRRSPGIVFCGHLYMAPLAAAIARLVRARLMIQAHGIEAWSAPSRLTRRAVEAADVVLCVSRHTRAAIVGWADIAPERVVVVPNTVAAVFAPGDGSALRKAWHLDGKKVLLTVGRLEPRERYKGHDRVIEVIPDLVGRGHDIAYLIIGEGDDRRHLERLARELGVAERVHFTGAVAPEVLVEAYRAADLYVMPSTGEGFGIAFLEAMASGIPALGLAAGGAPDALADGALGITVPATGLGAAIDRLLGEARRDPDILAERTRARFGRKPFCERVNSTLERFCAPAG